MPKHNGISCPTCGRKIDRRTARLVEFLKTNKSKPILSHDAIVKLAIEVIRGK